MYTISDTAKSNIERAVGLSIDKIKTMSSIDERRWVEKRTKSKLTFSKNTKRSVTGRGNPLLSRRKFRTLEDLDKKSKKYIGI